MDRRAAACELLDQYWEGSWASERFYRVRKMVSQVVFNSLGLAGLAKSMDEETLSVHTV